MHEYINNNLVVKEENEYIIFNVPSSRIFTAEPDTSNLTGLLKEINIKCQREIVPKVLPEESRYRNLVISCAETCNLQCSYCFANKGTYNTKERKVMQDEDYDKLLEFIKSIKEPLNSLCLFGGEPLLNVTSIIKFFKALDKYYKIMQWKLPKFGIVTNGTLIDERVIDFFNEYRIFVSISLDGPKEVNDQSRYFADRSKSVYDTVLENIKKMKNKEFLLTIVATMSRKELRRYQYGDYKKVVEHFKEIGADIVEYSIADENIDLTEEDIYKLNQFAKEQVQYTFDKIHKRESLNYLSRIPMGAISAILKKKYVPECPAGKYLFYYTAHGELYPCQLYYSAHVKQSNLISRSEHPVCKDCFCVNICSYFCPGSSVLANGTEKSVIQTRCIFCKAIIKECITHLNKYLNARNALEKDRDIFINNLIDLSKEYLIFK